MRKPWKTYESLGKPTPPLPSPRMCACQLADLYIFASPRIGFKVVVVVVLVLALVVVAR